MSNHLPDSWLRQALGCLVTVQGGNAFKSDDFCEQGIPVNRISNIKSGVIDLTEAVFAKESPSFSKFLALNGDVLVAMSGATTGKIGRYRIDRPAYINQRVGRFVVKDKKSVSIDYIYHLSGAETFQAKLLIDAIGGAQPNISNSSIEALTVDVPPIVEQQKIASILTAVDEVIESTQAQINKLKDLKTGMMQELLTKGIGHTEFKDSPVGRIPKEWKFVRFDEVVTKVGSGITPSGGSAVYTTTGVPFVRSQNVYQDGLRWDDVCFISKEQHQKMKNSQLKPRDVLLNITGASIGRCYYLPDQFGEGNVNQHVCIIRCEHAQIQHIYLAHFINSDFGQKQIMNLQAGGNREGLNFQQIRAMELPLPPLDEQLEISNVILSIESNISKRTAKLNSLCRLKKSLMHDLLTGKVRVVSP